MLIVARALHGVPLRAQGNYNSWSVLNGLRSVLGPTNAVDSHFIPFLYNMSQSAAAKLRPRLYGIGFGYAFHLPLVDVNRTKLSESLRNGEFDAVVYADPASVLMNRKSGAFLFYADASVTLPRNRIAFVHAPDVAYGDPQSIGYDVTQLYDLGTVFQREIADCEYYVPHDRASERMKRCIWYRNRNCFDDVNMVEIERRGRPKQQGTYTWSYAPRPASFSVAAEPPSDPRMPSTLDGSGNSVQQTQRGRFISPPGLQDNV